MTKKQLHEKLSSLLDNIEYSNMLDSFTTIIYNLQQEDKNDGKLLIPLEANFQLPNQFLGVKTNMAAERFLSEANKLNVDENKILAAQIYLQDTGLSIVETETTEAKQSQNQISEFVRRKFFG
ncbi:hypothetical protein ECANGB1_131 [Enterospora canceri]|uniref:Uncharacterized protein n=1 Tax=Enterospora canceri TaxID=1081671 RepID=A0A1Y1S8C6_9MICR|nr:hypothetical protein ECANGB1_131 [Enterospora canceri]